MKIETLMILNHGELLVEWLCVNKGPLLQHLMRI